MAMTSVEANRSQKMYGCDIEEFMDSVTSSVTFELCGISMVIASQLSDVQEMYARGMTEEARQTINRVKYMIANSKIELNKTLG
jgi:diaminopimelate decarboxylase